MSRILTKEEWRKRRQHKRIVMRAGIFLLLLALLIFIVFTAVNYIMNHYGASTNEKEILTGTLSNGEEIQINYLTSNPFSRPGTALKKVKGIVVHYTANPGTSAENNRSYFEGLATKQTTKASSHYIIGLEGEIIQCIPLNEQSYASNDRNDDTISIECCHPDETGKFNDVTYASLVALTAALCNEYDLQEEDVIRHYDVTQKLCPLYFVEHEDAWVDFKADVKEELDLLISSSGS
jgi:N-acetyl-anhydromuramyl-L-alanine amidase AmpD